MALYNEVRPQTLSELKGQEDVIKILRRSVASGTLPNAAIFTGTRGTGKTTVARILAKTVNCENPRENGDPCCECASCVAIRNGQSLDVIELDAASNNGVDDVRHIIELVQYKTVSKKKVVILDEVHMLSTGAFNALLKVLEEPPKDVLFILCTTEQHKVPATITSRCRKLQFKSLTIAEITSKLEKICSDRNKKAEGEALSLVAKAAKGSMRDAESIFESFLELDEITAGEVRKVLGFSSEERIVRILAAVADGQPWVIRDALSEATDNGENLFLLTEEVIEALIKMASVMMTGDVAGISSDVSELCFKYSEGQIFDLIEALRKTYEAKPSNMEVSLLATLVGRACAEDRLAEMRKEIESLKQGGFAPAKADEPTAEPKAETPSEADEEGWDRLLESAEFESIEGYADAADVPFESPAPAPKPAAEKVSVPVETAAAEVNREVKPISRKALSSLAAAGFVVEGAKAADVPEKKAEVPEKKVETEKQAENAVFDEFAALFNF